MSCQQVVRAIASDQVDGAGWRTRLAVLGWFDLAGDVGYSGVDDPEMRTAFAARLGDDDLSVRLSAMEYFAKVGRRTSRRAPPSPRGWETTT